MKIALLVFFALSFRKMAYPPNYELQPPSKIISAGFKKVDCYLYRLLPSTKDTVASHVFTSYISPERCKLCETASWHIRDSIYSLDLEEFDSLDRLCRIIYHLDTIPDTVIFIYTADSILTLSKGVKSAISNQTTRFQTSHDSNGKVIEKKSMGWQDSTWYVTKYIYSNEGLMLRENHYYREKLEDRLTSFSTYTYFK